MEEKADASAQGRGEGLISTKGRQSVSAKLTIISILLNSDVVVVASSERSECLSVSPETVTRVRVRDDKYALP